MNQTLEAYSNLIENRFKYFMKSPDCIEDIIPMDTFHHSYEVESMPYGVDRDVLEAQEKYNFYKDICDAIQNNDYYLVGQRIADQIEAQIMRKASDV